MSYPQHDPADTSIVDAAELALVDPRVQRVTTQPAGIPFDYNRPQQTWVIPDATEDITAFKIARKGGGPDFDSPHLVPYAIPVQWATKPNVQDNPSGDGFTQPYAALPLRALAADESLVTLGAGAFNIPQVYLRRGAPPANPPNPGSGMGFTDADRKNLAFVVQGMKTLLGQ